MTQFARQPFVRRLFAAALFLLLGSSPVYASSGGTDPTLIQSGFHSMYNLDFDHATQDFDEWEKLHPEDPMGPVSHAAALLFSEFHRLGVLEARLFVDDKSYEGRKKPDADPKIEQQFQHALNSGDQLAD